MGLFPPDTIVHFKCQTLSFKSRIFLKNIENIKKKIKEKLSNSIRGNIKNNST